MNERLILDSRGSFDPAVYRRMLGWGFFRRMKRVDKREAPSGWISQEYDTAEFVERMKTRGSGEESSWMAGVGLPAAYVYKA